MYVWGKFLCIYLTRPNKGMNPWDLGPVYGWQRSRQRFWIGQVSQQSKKSNSTVQNNAQRKIDFRVKIKIKNIHLPMIEFKSINLLSKNKNEKKVYFPWFIHKTDYPHMTWFRGRIWRFRGRRLRFRGRRWRRRPCPWCTRRRWPRRTRPRPGRPPPWSRL